MTTKSLATVETVEVPAKLSPAALVNIAQDEMRPTVLTVDDDTRATIIKEAAQTEAVVAFLLEKGSVAGLDMLNAITRLRRLFPASPERQALLGPDACDLIGETDDYKKAIAAINEEAVRNLVSRLRRDGYSGDVATDTAKRRIETVRKNVSVQYRRYVEQMALNTCDGDRTAAAALLLAHGYGHHTAIETKKAPQLIRPNQQVEVAEGEGEGVRKVGPSLLKVVTPAPKVADPTPANEPNEQSDQTPPTETADAHEKALLGDDVLNPNTIINECVGMLRRAATLLPQAKMTKAQRIKHRENLLSAVFALIGELQEPLSASDSLVISAVKDTSGN